MQSIREENVLMSLLYSCLKKENTFYSLTFENSKFYFLFRIIEQFVLFTGAQKNPACFSSCVYIVKHNRTYYMLKYEPVDSLDSAEYKAKREQPKMVQTLFALEEMSGWCTSVWV